jgi:hypothetical protein
MDTLFREGLLRLAGRSDQAAFELAQAMGGGKTHLMVALGLLAKYPHLRAGVLPADLAERLDFGPARRAAFNGCNDPEHYIRNRRRDWRCRPGLAGRPALCPG